MKVLDLFSAAAGGWSLGLHRAGFETVAACEVIPWRRELYAQNFPNVRLYDDVRTLTAERLRADLGALPDCIVGSPPCQDISSANTKGQGVDGARSGLFFEAVRIIGECRPRWVALENSPRVRTKGYDRIASRMEALGYSGEPCVVGADDVLANHERKRAWMLFCDPEQLADADGFRRHAGWRRGRFGLDISVPEDSEHAPGFGHESRRAWRRRPDGDRPASTSSGCSAGDAKHDEVGGGEGIGRDAAGPWSEWNGGLAGHLRLDDGLSAWVAQSRIAIGGPRGTAAAGLLVEAFGDAVLPQIPEAIGRAILRTEAALAAIYGAAA